VRSGTVGTVGTVKSSSPLCAIPATSEILAPLTELHQQRVTAEAIKICCINSQNCAQQK